MTQLHDLTALEQGQAVADGTVSSTELVEHYQRRADTVGAFITRAHQYAIDRVAELPSVLDDDRSPLFGVPTAIKDLNNVAGLPTTFGSQVFQGYVPDESDAFVTAIERAGMVIVGKTNTPEFGSPCYTSNQIAPTAVTPYDTSRIAGGSSGGAAAAVAAGLIPVAQGSDGGGSIRIPASCCGLVGFKPSRGVVSAAPRYGDPTGLATAGPIARTVRDAAAFLDVMAGYVTGDPFWGPPVGAASFLAACDVPLRPLRIARLATPVIVDGPVDPACIDAYDATAVLLEELGHHVEEITFALPPGGFATFETNWSVLSALWPIPEDAKHLVSPLNRWLAKKGEKVSGAQFGAALGQLRQLGAFIVSAFAPYDAVLTPTLAAPPVPVGTLRNDDDPAADFLAQSQFTPWTSLYNVSGLPAVSLPLGQTDGGLPIGVMLGGQAGGDAALFALAAQIEAARPFRHTAMG